jgi:predicted metal-dependent hydrolase
MQLTLPLFASADERPPSAAPPLPPAETPRIARADGAPPSPDPEVRFVRTPRARRYILRVCPDGSLRVTLPRAGSKRAAREFIARQRAWIERERARVLGERAALQWRDGTEIWLRGERVRISASTASDGTLTLCYAERHVRAAAGISIRDALQWDLRRVAAAELAPRLHQLAAVHGLTVGRVSIRNQRSRWGSCARGGNIALNFRLVQMPPPIRDYVLLHELMHLRQQNHSRRFWQLVEEVCPHFREAEQWLRTEGKALF